MSTVFIGIGQCGNQLCHAFRKLLEPRYVDVLCNVDGKFSAVNVDSERKVVRTILADFRTRCNTRNVVTGVKGCGNNWALGYYGNKDDDERSLLSVTLNAVRRECEKCPSFAGIIVFQSLAGGTGAGFGSLLVERLRDEYPMNYILSCAVAPHESGETPLQDYNSCLCLSVLNANVDGVLLFRNDNVLLKCENEGNPVAKRSKPEATRNVSLNNYNRYIARCIAELMLPSDSVSGRVYQGVGFGMEPWELVRSLCPLPRLKFLHADCSSINSQTVAVRAAKLVSHQHGTSYCTNIAGVFSLRGSVTPAALNGVKDRVQFEKWNPFPVDIWTASTSPFTPNGMSSVAAATNCSGVVPYLDRTMSRAKTKFNVSAYVHWYTKFGCSCDEISESFTNLDEIVTSYSSALQ